MGNPLPAFPFLPAIPSQPPRTRVGPQPAYWLRAAPKGNANQFRPNPDQLRPNVNQLEAKTQPFEGTRAE
jgi:hypothetical protein